MSTLGPVLVDVEDAHVVYRVYEDKQGQSRRERRRQREIHALRGVSFTLRRGESIGIVGRNGSGKSTLLNALTGLQPLNSGRIRVSERPTLLGVGAALQASLSGRRNIELGGLALGQSPQEVANQTEAIIEFAELADFIDLPLASYSSGMRARLAFSIATASIPSILLVDEALAVGDASFARRSAERIAEIRAQAGAVVLVSHNMEEIATSCDRVIWIDQGEMRADGPTDEVISEYQQTVVAEQTAAERVAAVEQNEKSAAVPTRATVAAQPGPRRFVLHIGSSMAGTQGVQNALNESETALADNGYWFPAVAGRLNQYPLVSYASRLACGLVGVSEEEWPEWRADFARRFLEAAPLDGSAVASTSHASAYLDEEGITELTGLLEQAGFEELVPVLVVRRQDERASQRMIERLRSGELDQVDVTRFATEPNYDLAVIHDAWQASPMVDRVDLRMWPPGLDRPTPAEHVFDGIGMTMPLTERHLQLDQLPAIDLHQFEFARRLAAEMRNQGGFDLHGLRFAIASLGRRPSGQLAIDAASAAALMAHFETSNRKIANLMGREAEEYLFAAPNAANAPEVADLENAATVYRYALTEA